MDESHGPPRGHSDGFDEMKPESRASSPALAMLSAPVGQSSAGGSIGVVMRARPIQKAT